MLRVVVLCNAETALRGIVAVSVRRECVPVFTSTYRFVSCMCGRAVARGYGANGSCCNCNDDFLVKLRGASAWCPCMCGVHDSNTCLWWRFWWLSSRLLVVELLLHRARAVSRASRCECTLVCARRINHACLPVGCGCWILKGCIIRLDRCRVCVSGVCRRL